MGLFINYKMNINNHSLIFYSVGLENVEDLEKDLKQALDKVDVQQ